MSEFKPKDYWENILTENFTLQGTGYRDYGKNYNKWLYKVKWKTFLRAVNSLNIEKINEMDVIDIGCGTGFFIEAWKRLGVRNVAGADITAIAVNKLKRKFPNDKFYQLDIGDTLAISPHQYDIVSSFDVLYHIVDDKRYCKSLENIYSLIRPQGFFIFSDNFVHGKPQRITDQVSRSIEDIELILNRTGFQIVKRLPEFVLMNYPVDSNRLRGFLWLVMMLPVHKSELFGFLLGGFMYPIELLLTSMLKESATTEIMICKKPA